MAEASPTGTSQSETAAMTPAAEPAPLPRTPPEPITASAPDAPPAPSTPVAAEPAEPIATRTDPIEQAEQVAVRPTRPRLNGVSAIRAFFRRNTTPIYFISPTPFNLLGVDRWISNFHYVNYYDSFDGAHPRVFVPR
ncbi:MAG: hypothetical protein QOC75_3745, partial [Pseudonocardiales bacterium]|nr:hypothetical protein [Pseudonocardiales bacterium]